VGGLLNLELLIYPRTYGKAPPQSTIIEKQPSQSNTMLETITATYRDGTLHPLHPLQLQEHQTIQLQILTSIATPDLSLLNNLRNSGFVTIATPPPSNAISDHTLESLVNQIPMTQIPTSQTIIEDRGE
jgi:predicted DNA-binding antitoxin AbrB/MazE fold protein